MEKLKEVKGYQLLSSEELGDISSVAYVFKHIKTGARVAIISNDDENKAFMIGFRTPPTDSTGVPHILEHSVLGGSDKYPVKDAMTEVMKGSLNTFMNAFTYQDRTIYPFSSCNDKDFQNILDVYLDAVFHPQVYHEPKVFYQEGWHYAMENPEDELSINGVVYNEMKGVYSSPDELMGYEALFSLFPDTQNGVCSGGDPDFIPDLSYDQFLDFHRSLYHPSNSEIFLYGDMDFEEKLKFIDENYLSKYDFREVDSKVSLQKAFDEPKYLKREYPVSADESDENATFLTYNVVCSDYTKCRENEAMNILNYALCTVPGALLKTRLIDAGIGKDVYSCYYDDMCQKMFQIVVEGANASDESRFVEIVENSMRDIIRDGFDAKTIEAAITTQEFSYREADFGSYPKGIAYGLSIFDIWNYTDDNIFRALKLSDSFAFFKKERKNGYFENLLKESILENPHKTILTMSPKKGLMQEKEQAFKEKMANIKSKLSKDEIKAIVKNTKALLKYQDAPDSKKALATIPTLSMSDIDEKGKEYVYTVSDLSEAKEIYTDVSSNGISYVTFSFCADCIKEEDMEYLGLLPSFLGMMDTKNFSYGDLVNEVNIETGGISFATEVVRHIEHLKESKPYLNVKFKTFSYNIEKALNLVNEILFSSKLDDKKRLKELIMEVYTQAKSSALSAGHSIAISRAYSYFSINGYLSDKLNGLGRFRLLEKLASDFDKNSDDLISKMQEILSKVLTKDRLEICIACEKSFKDDFDKYAKDFIQNLSDEHFERVGYDTQPLNLKEGLTSASQVLYVARAGNFLDKGLPYTGSLSVLRQILSMDFLWNEIRVKGGAYGAITNFLRGGLGFFCSYRDPNLQKTLDVYTKISDYLKTFPRNQKLVERFAISAIGELDTPHTPSMVAMRVLSMYHSGLTNELINRDRYEVIHTTWKTIRELYKYIDAILEDEAICVVGGEQKIKDEQKDLENIVNLFND